MLFVGGLEPWGPPPRPVRLPSIQGRTGPVEPNLPEGDRPRDGDVKRPPKTSGPSGGRLGREYNPIPEG